MDLFDFFPVVPPGGPGDSRERSPGHQLASGVGSLLFPAVNFIIVLVAGFAHDGRIALVLMPLVSGVLLFVLARRFSVGVGWSLVLALCCAAFCFVASACALFLVGFMQFFRTF
jgi:hypothetical protein